MVDNQDFPFFLHFSANRNDAFQLSDAASKAVKCSFKGTQMRQVRALEMMPDTLRSRFLQFLSSKVGTKEHENRSPPYFTLERTINLTRICNSISEKLMLEWRIVAIIYALFKYIMCEIEIFKISI